MRRGEQAVGGVEEVSSRSLAALDAIVSSTADATGHARSIAGTAAEQDVALALLAERIRCSAEISRKNRRAAEDMASRAEDQARELAELERSTRELEAVATHLGDVARRFANA
jgi:methyl-accepting chemotaxis protein